MNAVTNEMRLEEMKNQKPLVTGDEKIAVFGAGGQIGTKLKPLLEKLYPGKVIYCESGANAAARGFTPVDICKQDEVRDFLKGNNVKAVINLAALLSAAADKDPQTALEVNFYAPINLMKTAREAGVRKVQIMSSMAAQEFDERRYDNDSVKKAKKELQKHASNSLHSMPDGQYGLQKTAIEVAAQMFSLYFDLDVNIPRLAGVLNAHLPWPSNGTTEELDKLIVAAAMQEVYKDKWHEKMTQLIGVDALKNGHYLRDGKYVPEVSAEATFDMVDGKTLPEAVLMLLHQDLRGQHGIAVPGSVHNVSEYSVSMKEAADILCELNPDFQVEFATTKDNGLDPGKMMRAQIWPASQDTASTKGLIGEFQTYDAKQSISENYHRVVAALKKNRLEEMGVAIAGQPTYSSRAAS